MLEVMAGLGITLVVAGISTPVASEYMKSYRLVSATDSVAGQVRELLEIRGDAARDFFSCDFVTAGA